MGNGLNGSVSSRAKFTCGLNHRLRMLGEASLIRKSINCPGGLS